MATLQLMAVDASYHEAVLLDVDVRPFPEDGSYAVVAQVIGGTQHCSLFTFRVARLTSGFAGRDWVIVDNENEQYASRKAAIIGEVEDRLYQSGLERRIRHLDGKD